MSWLSKAWGDVTGKTARKQAAALAQRQMEQFDATKRELKEEEARISEEKKVERGKVEETQLRALRRGYRRPGFLEDVSEGQKDTLG
jgi:hypothetical protein